MPIERKIRLITGLAAMSVLAACSYGNVGPAENQTEAASVDAQHYLAQSNRPLAPENLDRIRMEEGVWTGSTSRRNDRGTPLPRQWERPDGFVLHRGTPMQIFEIGSAITEITNIPVTFSPDVMNNTTGGAAAPATPAPTAQAGPGGTPALPAFPSTDINSLLGGMGLGGTPASTAAAGSGNAANVQGGQIRPVTSSRIAMRADFQGRLSQFLNQMSAHFGVGWEYGAGEIRVFRNLTRTYTVQALPSSIKLDSSLSADSSTQGGGSSGGGATANAAQKVSSTVNIQIWDDITKNVTGIVGSQGNVTTAVSTGTITVNAPSGIIQRVQTYLDGQNERLGKQVTVGLTVLSVELKDGDNTALDIGGLFSKAGDYGLAFGTPLGVARGTAAIASAAITNPLGSSQASGGGIGFNVTNPNSRFNGSNALVQALATKGRVSLRTTTSVTTLNGVPAPVQVANTRGYVQSVSVTDGTTSGSSTTATRTSIQPGSITTGFSMSMLPRIDPDNSAVLLQYNINLSELVGATNGFDIYTSPDGQSSVQLPNVNSRNFVQQARIPNGSTLVLTGFEQTSNTANRTGSFGDSSFMGLGGSQVGQRNRTAIVILLTPTVVSNQVIVSE